MQNRTVVRFFENSVDGWDTELLCVDGKWHVEAHHDLDQSIDFRIRGRCDGSCGPTRPATDLRLHVAKIRAVEFETARGHVVMPQFHADGAFRKLLRADQPIAGPVFKKGYAKRSCEWIDVCLAGQLHVHVVTDFAWAHDPEQSYTYRIRTEACDGSCKPQPFPLSRRKARDLEIEIASSRQ